MSDPRLYDLLRRWQREKLLHSTFSVSEMEMHLSGKDAERSNIMWERMRQQIGRQLGTFIVEKIDGIFGNHGMQYRERDMRFELRAECYVLTVKEFEELVTLALGPAQRKSGPGDFDPRQSDLADAMAFAMKNGVAAKPSPPEPKPIDRQALLKKSGGTGTDIV